MRQNLVGAMVLLGALASAPAAQAVFGLQLGLNAYKPKLGGPAYASTQSDWKRGIVARLYFAGKQPRLYGFEGGGAITQRSYKTTSLTAVENVAYRTVSFDGLLRLGPRFLNVGVGAYLAVYLPDADFQRQGGAGSTRSLAALDQKYADYGLVLSGRIRLPFRKLGLTGDLRYLHGLANTYKDSSNSIHTQEVQVLAGLEF